MSDIVKEILRVISSSLQIPTIIILILLILLTILMLGSFVAEIFTERKSLKLNIPGLVDQLQGKNSTEMKEAIEESGLLNRQKESARELISRTSYNDDTREALARQLISDEDLRYNKIVKITDLVARVAPMFGLMGTLIPLGPGLIALGQGDTSTLSSSLLIAFDTTVAGLISGAISYVISGIRKNWYEEYMIGLETVMETILDVQSQERDAAAHGGLRPAGPIDGKVQPQPKPETSEPKAEKKKGGRFKFPGSKATAVDVDAQKPKQPEPKAQPAAGIAPAPQSAVPGQAPVQAPVGTPVPQTPPVQAAAPEMLNIENAPQELKAEDVISDLDELIAAQPQQPQPQQARPQQPQPQQIRPQTVQPQQVRPQQPQPQQVRPQQVSPRRETLTQPVQPHATNVDPHQMTRNTQTQPHNPEPNSKMEHTMVQRSFQEEVRAAEQAMLAAQKQAEKGARQVLRRPEGQ